MMTLRFWTTNILRALISVFWLAAAGLGYANDLLVNFRLVPEAPNAGQDFSVLLTVPNLEIRQLRLEEPQFARTDVSLFTFRGGSIRPLQGMALPAVVLQYDFSSAAFAGAAEFIEDLVSFAVLVDGRKRELGTWRIALPVVSSLRSRAVLEADWIIEDTAWQFQALSGHIALRGGGRLPLPLVPSLEGVLFEPLPGQGGFLAAARKHFTLPAVEFDHEGRSIRLSDKTVQVKALPDTGGGPAAIGTYRASLNQLPKVVPPGERLAVQLRIEGSGSPVFLREPELLVVFREQSGASSRLELPAVHRYQHFSASSESWHGQTVVQYDLQTELPGTYTFSLAAWPVLNPATGRLQATALAPVEVRVERPAEKAGNPTPELRRDLEALVPLSAGLPASARQELLSRASVVPFPASSFADLSDSHLLGLAAEALLADRKQAALNILVQLRKSANPPKAATMLADYALTALAQPGLFSYSVPAPLLVLILLLCASGLAGLGFVCTAVAKYRHRSQPPANRLFRQEEASPPDNGKSAALRKRFFGASLVFALLAMGLALMLSVSVIERQIPVFASNGEAVRGIPSAEGRLLFVAPIGLPARIRNQAGDWYFIEYRDGRNGWIRTSDTYK